MAAHIADSPFLQTEDRIRFPNRGEAMRDENNNFVGFSLEESFHDEQFVFCVKLARALVKNQDLTILQNHPDNHDELPLAAGEIDIPAQRGVEPEPEGSDLFREPEFFEELPEVFVGSLTSHPEQEIFADGEYAIENERVLTDDGSQFPQTGTEYGANLRVIVFQRTVVFGKKPEYLVYQRGFSRAVFSDNPVYPSFAKFGRDIPEHDGGRMFRLFPEILEHVKVFEILIVRFRRILLDALDGDVDELQFFLDHFRISEREALDSDCLDFFLKLLLLESFPMCRDREKNFEFSHVIRKRTKSRYHVHQKREKFLNPIYVHDTHRHQPHAAGSGKNRVSDDAFDDCARYPLVQHVQDPIVQIVQHGFSLEFDLLSQSIFRAFQHGIFCSVHPDIDVLRFQLVVHFPQLMFEGKTIPQFEAQPVGLLQIADFRAGQQG